jgi:antitoxin (DNA-binding transcriptional repressor) of toxin-antitoxin stability system
MSENILTVEEAAGCLSELVDRIHANGDSAILVKSGQRLARIVPVPPLGHVADDIVSFVRRWRIDHPEPDEQFAEAIQDSRRAIKAPQDPWE